MLCATTEEKKIGPDRFSCIQKVVRECLETYPLNEVLGYCQEIPPDNDKMSQDESVGQQVETHPKHQ